MLEATTVQTLARVNTSTLRKALHGVVLKAVAMDWSSMDWMLVVSPVGLVNRIDLMILHVAMPTIDAITVI